MSKVCDQLMEPTRPRAGTARGVRRHDIQPRPALRKSHETNTDGKVRAPRRLSPSVRATSTTAHMTAAARNAIRQEHRRERARATRNT
jgi:hypothetical protein